MGENYKRRQETVSLNKEQLDCILEWYRTTHHGVLQCPKPIGQCHAARNVILDAAKRITAPRRERNTARYSPNDA